MLPVTSMTAKAATLISNVTVLGVTEPKAGSTPSTSIYLGENVEVITDEKGSSYKVTKSGEVTFAKPKSSVKGTVTIPDTVTIDGITYKVTAIEANAFKNNKNITKVIIGKNVTVIGNNAFSGCKKLKTITVKTTKLKSVGKKALKGIHAKAKIKVPKSKLKKNKSLFKNKGQGKNVKVSK